MTKQILTIVESCHICPHRKGRYLHGFDASLPPMFYCGDRKKYLKNVEMGTIDIGCLLDDYTETQGNKDGN